MSSSAEIIRASYAAFHRGDIDGAMTLFAPDIEWTHPDGMHDFGLGGTKKGHGEVRAFMTRARRVFSELRPEPHEFVESGDRVVVFGTHHMRGARSGVAGSVPFVHSWRLAGGKATHFEDVHDTAEVRRIVQPTVQPGEAVGDWRDHIVQSGLGFWRAKVLLSAVELDLFTQLGDERLDSEELRSRLGLHGRGVRDFLDALVSMNLLERGAGRYRNTAATAMFLNRAQPETFLGGLLDVANERWWEVWGNLTTALRTGASQDNAANGDDRDPFDVLYADPVRVRKFQQAMTGGALTGITALIERLPWATFDTVADVGCCAGALLGRLLARHPGLSGVGFDLPPLASAFADTAAEIGVADRMVFMPGNFFTDDLPATDVLVLGHVLHDWDLATKRMLLAKAHAALPPGGLVVIYDTMIDDERRRNTFGMLMSLHMLLESPGGFDYTGADCLDWLAGAGFQDCSIEHLAGAEYLAIGRKPVAADEVR